MHRQVDIRIGMLTLAVPALLLAADVAFAACVDEPLEPSDAQVYWRWISRLDDPQTGCQLAEPPTGWTARPLFDAGARTLWPSLEKFCVYEHDGIGDLDLEGLAAIDGLDGAYDQFALPPTGGPAPPRVVDAIAPDLLAVAPAGSLGDALRPELAALFDEQAGHLGPLPDNDGGPTVRLALLDTSPTGGSMLEASDHGLTLRLLAERLLCGGSSCPVDLHPRLALAYRTVDAFSRALSPRHPVEGGFAGLLGELAESVADELLDWRIGASGDDRLVLNLSLAWDPLYGGGDLTLLASEMSPPVEAVYRALEAAACDPRTVTVAAAGNRSDRHPSSFPQEALLPAAWTERTVTCDGTTRPLVLAVAAADRLRRPLADAITSDLPEWTAYGDHATVHPGPAAVLTGSSVATLVVSSTLAAVAAYRADLEMPMLAVGVLASGDDLGVPADLCPLSGSCSNRRLVSLCAAIEAVCDAAQSHCPETPPSCPLRPVLLSTVGSLPPLPNVDVADWYSVTPLCASAACGEVDLRWSPFQSPPDALCPDRQHHGLARAPYTTPQPQSALCPTCPYRLYDGDFFVEIDSGGQTVGSPTLELTCSGSRISYTLVAPGGVLTDGSQLHVTSLPTGCSQAVLTYTLDTGGGSSISATEPVLILQ
ncbi:MAG: S8/S53 family peptidase [Acidobacteriota bacterium]